ncbi:MAG: carcinine hydrolase/isopenicillin-N N-acyltransferase family protein [Acidobacteriota bacterium]
MRSIFPILRVPATLVALLLTALAAVPQAWTCTTAVIAGSATADGRPLLWKNRDAGNKLNQVVYVTDGRYPFVGLVNGGDAAPFEVWAGINAAGFAIMNAASYNLDREETLAEGQMMRIALAGCATVADFQALLERTGPGGRDVNANFGVIDARGGAAFFETGVKGFTRFDAGDPSAAPNGVLVRTNYSVSGDTNNGGGFLRLRRASALLDDLAARKSLTARTLLAEVARDVANPHIGSLPATGAAAPFAYTADSICRYDTASVSLFAGARSGEDPLLATAWFIVGQPITGAAVPVWVRSAAVPAEIAVAAGSSPMTAACDAVRTLFYPETRGELKKFVRTEAFGKGADAPLPRLLALEAATFRRVEDALARWSGAAPSAAEVAALQAELAKATLDAVRSAAPRPQR